MASKMRFSSAAIPCAAFTPAPRFSGLISFKVYLMSRPKRLAYSFTASSTQPGILLPTANMVMFMVCLVPALPGQGGFVFSITLFYNAAGRPTRTAIILKHSAGII